MGTNSSSCKLPLNVRHSQLCYDGWKTIWLQWCFLLVTLLHMISAIPNIAVTSDASTNTKQGDTVELACIITGLTSSENIDNVRWTKRVTASHFITLSRLDSIIVSDPMNRFSVSDIVQSTVRVYTFTISGVLKEDSGLYSCIVGFTDGNNIPTETSNSLQVSVVYYTPPENSTSCQTLNDVSTFTIGATVTLSCTTQPGNPVVNVTWTREASGITEVIALKQVNNETEALLQYTFNITREHDGNQLTCTITSEAFPDFHRNCTIGPLVVIDIPTSSSIASTLEHTSMLPTTELLPTTLHEPSPFVPTTESSPTMITSPASTNMTSSELITNEYTYTNASGDFTTDNLNDNTSTSTDFTDDISPTDSAFVTYPDFKPDDPPNKFSLLAIVGIAAGSLIIFFLTCNVFMLTCMFSRQKKYRESRRSFRHRDSVLRENMNRLNYPEVIEEETEA